MREILFRSGLYSVGQILRSKSFSFPPVRCHCRCFGAASFEFHFICFVIVMSVFVFFRFFYLSFKQNARAWIDTMVHSPYANKRFDLMTCFAEDVRVHVHTHRNCAGSVSLLCRLFMQWLIIKKKPKKNNLYQKQTHIFLPPNRPKI